MVPTTKKKAVVLGATGMMGQKFVQLLANHPWLEVSAVAASDRSVGKSYAAAVGGQTHRHILDDLGDLQVIEATPRALADPDIVFSALPTEVAGPIEEEFAKAGFPVFSNASSHRMDRDVPLLNPEVNAEHASLVENQKRRTKWDGFIVANPNCTTAILSLSLKPLQDRFGLETVIVSTMQATVTVSASCQRVPTIHGHIEAVFAKTRTPTSPEEAAKSMSEFQSTPQRMKLPSAPTHPVIVREEEDRPQTRLDVDEGNGMTVSVGRLRRDSALDGIKYIVLGHNLVRGGAGCSILNAELLIAQKYIQ